MFIEKKEAKILNYFPCLWMGFKFFFQLYSFFFTYIFSFSIQCRNSEKKSHSQQNRKKINIDIYHIYTASIGKTERYIITLQAT